MKVAVVSRSGREVIKGGLDLKASVCSLFLSGFWPFGFLFAGFFLSGFWLFGVFFFILDFHCFYMGLGRGRLVLRCGFSFILRFGFFFSFSFLNGIWFSVWYLELLEVFLGLENGVFCPCPLANANHVHVGFF